MEERDHLASGAPNKSFKVNSHMLKQFHESLTIVEEHVEEWRWPSWKPE